jgi:hypothetical protein
MATDHGPGATSRHTPGRAAAAGVARADGSLRRLLTLALEDAEDTAEAEAILRVNEPRICWEKLKNGVSIESSHA